MDFLDALLPRGYLCVADNSVFLTDDYDTAQTWVNEHKGWGIAAPIVVVPQDRISTITRNDNGN